MIDQHYPLTTNQRRWLILGEILGRLLQTLRTKRHQLFNIKVMAAVLIMVTANLSAIAVADEIKLKHSGLQVQRLVLRLKAALSTKVDLKSLGDFRQKIYHLAGLFAALLRCYCGCIASLCALRNALQDNKHPAPSWYIYSWKSP